MARGEYSTPRQPPGTPLAGGAGCSERRKRRQCAFAHRDVDVAIRPPEHDSASEPVVHARFSIGQRIRRAGARD
jgi:hypothetical protein